MATIVVGRRWKQTWARRRCRGQLHIQLRHHRFDQHPVAVPCALPANRYPEISAGSQL